MTTRGIAARLDPLASWEWTISPTNCCTSLAEPRAGAGVNRGDLPVVIALLERGVRLRVASKEQVRIFAATTKPRLPDGTTLARMAECVQPLIETWDTPGEQGERVRGLLTQRRQVLEVQAQEEERLRVAEYPPIQEDLERHLAFLDRQLGGLHERLLYTVQAVPPRSW